MVGLSILFMVPFLVTGTQSSAQELERNFIPRADYEDILRRLQSLESQSEKSAILNKELTTKVEKLTEVVKQQHKRIDNQENKITTQDKTIARQRQKLSEQEIKIDYLQKLHLTRPNAVPNLWKPQQNLNTDGVDYRNKTDMTTAEPIQSNKAGKEINGVHPMPSVPRLKRAAAGFVAFQAFLGQQDKYNLVPGHTVKFGKVKHNWGGDYNPSDGIFTCRVPGYYMFHWRLMASAGHTAYVALIVNGNSYTDIFSDSTNYFNGDSEIAFLYLSAGDRVAIQIWYSTSSVHGHHSSFAGVLLS